MPDGISPGEALLMSMAAIPERGRVPLDIQAALDSAAIRLTSAEPVPTMLTLLSAGASAWYGPPPDPLVFPRDHGLHLDCGPEWYWLACTLDVVGAEGEQMGVLISMQRNRVVDPAVQALAGWTDEQAQLVFSYANVIHTTPQGGCSYGRRPNVIWPVIGGEVVMRSDPFTFACGLDRMEGSLDVMPLRVVIDDGAHEVTHMTIDLMVETDMPARSAFFLQGENGITPPPRAGFYYSWPQLRVSGFVSVGGRTYEVAGKGWLDHEMMYTPLPDEGPSPPPHWRPAPGIAGWTFCDFNFDNGDALVVAGFQDGPMLPDLPAPYGFYLTRVGDAWQKTFVTGLIVMDAFMPVTAEAMLPVAWNCLFTSGTTPPFELAAGAASWLVDSSFLALNQSVQGEAPVTVTLVDSHSDTTIGGAGYCESVGYEPPASYMARALAFLAR